MKKQMLMIMAAGALAFTACREDAGTSTETQENDSSTPDNAAGETNDSSTVYNYEQESRERANRMSSQISQDLKLDEATKARISTVMYNRARMMNELETRYSSTNRSAGMAADSQSTMSEDLLVEDDTMMDSSMAVQSPAMKVTGYPEDYPTQYYSELETINSNVDLEVKGFLTPEQFRMYEANRQKYYSGEAKYKAQDGSKLKVEGDEAKLKSGDTKVKRDGDETKLKTDNIKVKKEPGESKIKTDDTKLKREKGEVKYKSGDTKIKLEN
ncbi:hypothetical protein ACD591_00380 [Rufibacter glacialis]|uniref:Lipoprotein n=1 Tax=Rufibacter glacialis TaxID=1259555 RepID=A0A5M8QJC1_9BACT|nr:hypothetical protein [Rufibacter glacialis]KAA6435368.1 hypothetical protein FOE74_05295 [Rufibacter glacialis]GGK62789.1 hypothetical protein GCM10011405_08570 [Rufibacter glacialis]